MIKIYGMPTCPYCDYIIEDGTVTLDPAVVGLIEYGSPDACSIEDHKSGRKGC
ncbi:hypothetical protein SAMN02910275_01751 [Butyrivibrio sp. INlla18]|uniref:hypothetical protein n=1 Tax=Butyrivibrio sp. INlla18 TaxID=1520806 RepID=UPI00087E015D|nr:hypothetical protein [Butyrivibrio sp. INlla18]SDA63121.1 hypothetical protein SAMN02910275_01751 [Butyrivibrio sp. INlla18]